MRAFPLLIILGSLAGAWAQRQIGVEEILGKVAETYAYPQRCEFVIHSTSEWPGKNQSSTFFVHVAIQKPDRMRMQLSATGANRGPVQNPNDAVTVADGENTWVYSPKMAQFTKRKEAGAAVMDQLEHELFDRYRRAPGSAPLARLLRQETLEQDGRRIPCYVVEIAHDKKDEFLTWWIDQSRYIVLREDIEEGRGHTGEPVTYRESAVYTVVKINEPLSPDLFVFTPPPGAKQVEKFK